jgi:hypothetical protein
MITSGINADLAYALGCETLHGLYSMALSAPFLAGLLATWTTWFRSTPVKRISRFAFLACFALGAISHYQADVFELGF